MIYIALLIITLAAPVTSQDTQVENADSIVTRSTTETPAILFETNNYYLNEAFYPDYMSGNYDPNIDILLIQKKSAPLIALWDSLGGTLLPLIPALSGIPWNESSIKIHLMKYLPVPGLYEPLALPVEGIRQGGKIEAAPAGWSLFFQLLQYLSGRNLLQARTSDSGNSVVANHPLLEPSIYRFDVMAMTLAIACAKEILPPDTLNEILASERWQKLNPGWQIYKDYIRNKWPLSPEMTLLSYISSESTNSSLVEASAPPKQPEAENPKASKKGKPLPSAGKGKLGFSVVRGRGGYLDVVSIDSKRLAYLCGLRGGDRIQRVNGEQARNERELMNKILDKLDTDGAYLTILRDNQTKGILLRPLPPTGN